VSRRNRNARARWQPRERPEAVQSGSVDDRRPKPKRAPRPPACRYCGSRGHRAAACPFRCCPVCGGWGHVVRSCRMTWRRTREAAAKPTPTRLDSATKLSRARWRVVGYPECGEASFTWSGALSCRNPLTPPPLTWYFSPGAEEAPYRRRQSNSEGQRIPRPASGTGHPSSSAGVRAGPSGRSGLTGAEPWCGDGCGSSCGCAGSGGASPGPSGGVASASVSAGGRADLGLSGCGAGDAA